MVRYAPTTGNALTSIQEWARRHQVGRDTVRPASTNPTLTERRELR
jgi:hypothetical protein